LTAFSMSSPSMSLRSDWARRLLRAKEPRARIGLPAARVAEFLVHSLFRTVDSSLGPQRSHRIGVRCASRRHIRCD
jgi:hypothetical protein